jgi:hypothetical protein
MRSLREIREQHHFMAKLAAYGCDAEQIVEVTGGDKKFVSRLVNEDPTFRELISHYMEHFAYSSEGKDEMFAISILLDRVSHGELKPPVRSQDLWLDWPEGGKPIPSEEERWGKPIYSVIS